MISSLRLLHLHCLPPVTLTLNETIVSICDEFQLDCAIWKWLEFEQPHALRHICMHQLLIQCSLLDYFSRCLSCSRLFVCAVFAELLRKFCGCVLWGLELGSNATSSTYKCFSFFSLLLYFFSLFPVHWHAAQIIVAASVGYLPRRACRW